MSEKPYAMVPLGKDGELVKLEFGQIIEVLDDDSNVYERRFFGYRPGLLDPFYAGGAGWPHARIPKPKRPEIKIDEPVWVSDDGHSFFPRHFSGWSDKGEPTTYRDGYSRHTVSVVSAHHIATHTWNYVKTQDGTIWPPEGGEE